LQLLCRPGEQLPDPSQRPAPISSPEPHLASEQVTSEPYFSQSPEPSQAPVFPQLDGSWGEQSSDDLTWAAIGRQLPVEHE
jgi:hypothetical protein